MPFHILCLLKRHAWQWEPKSEQSCLHIKTCIRCGKKDSESNELIHKWSDWKYENQTSCNSTRKCLNCDIVQKEERHFWGDWYCLSSGGHARDCQRNKDHQENEPHRYISRIEIRTETQPQAGSCIDSSWGLCNDLDTIIKEQVRECLTCGDKEIKEIERRTEEVGRL